MVCKGSKIIVTMELQRSVLKTAHVGKDESCTPRFVLLVRYEHGH